jgi:prepilin-type processing-associated H-X9-DG protein
MDAIYPYIKSEALFNCPSHSLPVTIGTSTFDFYKFRTGRNYGSYAANSSYYNDPLPGNVGSSPFQNPSIAAWASPSTTVYAADSAARFDIGWPSGNPPILEGNPRYLYSPYQMVERHLNTSVVLFCDGHAKATNLDKLISVGTMGRYSAWTVQADPN